MADKETVTLKLPSGEMVDFVVPGGMSDSAVKTFVLSKRPDLFKNASPFTPPPDAVAQSQQVIQKLGPGNAPDQAMQQGLGGPPMTVNVPVGQGAKFTQAGQAGYAKGGKIGMEMVGAAMGGEAAGGAGLLGRMGAVGLGGGLGNAAGQAAGTGKVDPVESAGTGLAFAATEGLFGGAADMLKMIKNYRGTVSAGNALQKVRELIGQAPVDVGGAGNVALQARTLKELTRDRMPTVMQGFLDRATDPAKGPITFTEARDLYQKAGSLSANERNGLSGIMQKNLQEFRTQLGKSIQDTATSSGQGDTFSGAMQSYHQGMVAKDNVEFTKTLMMELLKKAATAGAGGGAAGYAAKEIAARNK